MTQNKKLNNSETAYKAEVSRIKRIPERGWNPPPPRSNRVKTGLTITHTIGHNNHHKFLLTSFSKCQALTDIAVDCYFCFN
jgi:hypothetical protein